ncbi:FmdB family zinc ribbon protein [Granulosicoccus antarcticus]|uniref:Putative regulatory protein FmdB zinc ribbon domain-containing protein n=1 Tax=Granulosicoccus antarcticus IMCC3135 TaxID=1192854 RepID=A0A2Z2P378_9GAMM|nr:zinc ribbon domain-containing protein [Granulosicoccus antarcticus]ASJ74214.1 hypothetical protein IMCC3135_20685 [Granulosicoccus antarcticus IMCC3135]
MPVYDYVCNNCGPHEFRRDYEDRDKAMECSQCQSPLSRAWLTAPRQSVTSAHTRHAMDVNELSSNVPKMSRDQDPRQMPHPASCGCCGSGKSKSKATVTAANGAKSFPGKRPWMISH